MGEPRPHEVLITDLRTGERRRYRPELGEWNGNGDEYLWSDGNFGCDCNRSLFFGRAAGTPEGSIEEAPCGHTRYAVAIEVDGVIVYEEDGAL